MQRRLLSTAVSGLDQDGGNFLGMGVHGLTAAAAAAAAAAARKYNNGLGNQIWALGVLSEFRVRQGRAGQGQGGGQGQGSRAGQSSFGRKPKKYVSTASPSL